MRTGGGGGGGRRVGEITNVRCWYRTVAIEVNFFARRLFLLFNPFLHSKAQVIGNSPIIRQCAPTCSVRFPFFPIYFRINTYFLIVQSF
jgi:hypothetical protein